MKNDKAKARRKKRLARKSARKQVRKDLGGHHNYNLCTANLEKARTFTTTAGSTFTTGFDTGCGHAHTHSNLQGGDIIWVLDRAAQIGGPAEEAQKRALYELRVKEGIPANPTQRVAA